MQQQLVDLATKFFTLMGVGVTSLEVICEDEERSIYQVAIQTPDSKLLIGIHGQTLDLTKHLLSRMAEKLIHHRIILHLEVNDYLKSKDERLFRYIDTKIEEAKTSSNPIILNQLTAYERKKVYSYIQGKNTTSIKAWSEGEWENRSLRISYEKTASDRVAEITEDGVGI